MRNLDGNSVKHLETIAGIVISGYSDLDQAGRSRVLEIVDKALGDRPQSMRRQLRIFLRVLVFLPVFRWGRPLGRLDGDRGERALRWFQDGPVGRFRQGFWGLKTLMFMGYYGRSEVGPEVGYAPNPAGRKFGDD